MAQLTTRNTGITPESAAELARLQAVEKAALTAAVEGFDTPGFASLNAAALKATNDLRKFEPEAGVTTYWDGENQIDVDEYDVTRLEQAAAGVDAPTEHVVGNSATGTAPSDDPTVAAQEDFLAAQTTDVSLTLDAPADQAVVLNTDVIRAQEEAAAAQAELERRQELAERTAQGQEVAEELNDWRVRLHLGETADYLYKSEDPGILQPLKDTNGIIFPYTPTIAIQHTAAYENYDLVHSNYRGYFYQGSKVENILITATFTANDVQEANYLLASMHFLRAATKMFYGQDTQRGMPPPVLFLTGLGEYQFNEHPCVVTMMNYNLPNDVDYIPCGKVDGVEPFIPPKGSTLDTRSQRLEAASLAKGGRNLSSQQIEDLGNSKYARDTWGVYNGATYVPTTIEITFTMLPIQTRDQVSKQFSLKDYASGKLLKKGFW